jgi:hypothetical protein
MDRSKRGVHTWKIVLRGETAGSVLSAQARVEALVDRLGVEAESPKAVNAVPAPL